MVIESELLQFKSMRELRKKSWFLRYCRGNVNEEVLGMRMMAGGEQPSKDELYDDSLSAMSTQYLDC